jgi:hypothetical protein
MDENPLETKVTLILTPISVLFCSHCMHTGNVYLCMKILDIYGKNPPVGKSIKSIGTTRRVLLLICLKNDKRSTVGKFIGKTRFKK